MTIQIVGLMNQTPTALF